MSSGFEAMANDGGDSMPPLSSRTSIKGLQLVDMDSRWAHSPSLNPTPCERQMAKNKSAYYLSDSPTAPKLELLIGRAPHASSSRAQGAFHDDTKEREEGEAKGCYTWVHPSPVLSRSHAIVSLEDDEVLLIDAGSHHGIWRSSTSTLGTRSPVLERVDNKVSVHDGDIFTLGKQVEKHGQIHYPARIQIRFMYTDPPSSPTESQPVTGPNAIPVGTKSSPPSSNRYGLDPDPLTDSESIDLDVADGPSITRTSLDTGLDADRELGHTPLPHGFRSFKPLSFYGQSVVVDMNEEDELPDVALGDYHSVSRSDEDSASEEEEHSSSSSSSDDDEDDDAETGTRALVMSSDEEKKGDGDELSESEEIGLAWFEGYDPHPIPAPTPAMITPHAFEHPYTHAALGIPPPPWRLPRPLDSYASSYDASSSIGPSTSMANTNQAPASAPAPFLNIDTYPSHFEVLSPGPRAPHPSAFGRRSIAPLPARARAPDERKFKWTPQFGGRYVLTADLSDEDQDEDAEGESDVDENDERGKKEEEPAQMEMDVEESSSHSDEDGDEGEDFAASIANRVIMSAVLATDADAHRPLTPSPATPPPGSTASKLHALLNAHPNAHGYISDPTDPREPYEEMDSYNSRRSPSLSLNAAPSLSAVSDVENVPPPHAAPMSLAMIVESQEDSSSSGSESEGSVHDEEKEESKMDVVDLRNEEHSIPSPPSYTSPARDSEEPWHPHPAAADSILGVDFEADRLKFERSRELFERLSAAAENLAPSTSDVRRVAEESISEPTSVAKREEISDEVGHETLPVTGQVRELEDDSACAEEWDFTPPPVVVSLPVIVASTSSKNNSAAPSSPSLDAHIPETTTTLGKRTRDEEVDASSLNTKTPLISSSPLPGLSSSQSSDKMLIDEPDTTATEDEGPPSPKRARVGSATANLKGFLAGAVAGGALTWAGMAFL